MPPLTHNPNTFYAQRGTEEDFDFLSQARDGQFDVWKADTPESGYHIFSSPGDIPTLAMNALVRITEDNGEGGLTVEKETLKSLKTISLKNITELGK